MVAIHFLNRYCRVALLKQKGEKMAEYHVGCGIAGIYAGTLKKNGIEWLNKSEVSHEALCAVAQYLLFCDKEFRFQYKDQWYVMRIEETAERREE
jgi:hypothetical protein